MLSLSIKERKAKIPSFLAPSKKYIMVEEIKGEPRDLKNILNEIKKLVPLREQENNEIKNEIKRKKKFDNLTICIYSNIVNFYFSFNVFIIIHWFAIKFSFN